MHVVRWKSNENPQESSLRQDMLADGLSPYSWSNGPHYAYAVHKHEYEKILYCVQGSIRFDLPDIMDSSGISQCIHLAPGDCLVLPPGTRHSAEVGSHGVTCLEAAR